MGVPVTDCILCTVHIGLLTAPIAFSTVENSQLLAYVSLQIAKYATISEFVAQINRDDAIRVQLGCLMDVVLLILGFRARPEGSKGEFPYHNIDCHS
jgi:hypothetical protein